MSNSNKIVLTVENNHVENCGQPPALKSSDFSYASYFQNRYGEQLVFVQERDTGHTYVYMGDCDWKRRLRVIAGSVPGITLNDQESEFVQLCWRVATRDGVNQTDGDLHDEFLALVHVRVPKKKAERKAYVETFLNDLKAFATRIGNNTEDTDA